MARKYKMVFEPFTENNYINADGCNSITFINAGTINFSIEGFTLTPAAQLSINGLDGEEDTTKYRLLFSADGGICQVLRKVYTA